MRNERLYNYLDHYLLNLQAEGKRSFSISSLQEEFQSYSLNALQMNLKRLNKKKKIKHIMKGFYVIIPPEYRFRKILPPELFIDALFAYLNRPYYAGLLSAALLHGATHQQAMEFFVFINKPPIRSTEIEGLKINYVVKKKLPEVGLERRKTETGYMKISNAELTALDLIQYNHRIGGLNRAATILYELSESMDAAKLKEVLQTEVTISVLQRMGYILDRVLNNKELSNVIKSFLADKKIFRIPLKAGKKKEGFNLDSEWKVIKNFKIETDFV